MKIIMMSLCVLFTTLNVVATEYHVAKTGNDKNKGTEFDPFLSIQAAANIAVAGDVITVHKGVYRERVAPKNGGKNKLNRIVYQAAKGEKVIIKGSEVVEKWKKVKKSVWKAMIPNSVFKNYNPYATLLEGDWFISEEIIHHTGEVYINGKSMFEQNSLEDVVQVKECEWSLDKKASLYAWYAEVNETNTTIWANFQDINPNKESVEINAREACFYPSETGRDFITVKGFQMSQAATQWAAPTAEQPGLIGTHWSKGWIIENNIVSNSKSVGISLGKDRATGHNVWNNNRNKDGATHYNEVVFKALNEGWSKEKIGSHIVRNNVIFNCGQAGVVGSLGAVFSKIYNNHIYDIYTKRHFTGMEMAGIKIHAAIDVLIEKNRIHNTHCGIWLDWMAQGARVTRNVLYNNDQYDYHDEVNHGPLMIDHNLFLSTIGVSTVSRSEGAGFVHNLLAGRTKSFVVKTRTTPYHIPHSTKIKGVKNIDGGDNRFFNNIYIGVDVDIDLSANRQIKGAEGVSSGLDIFDKLGKPSFAEGNVFYNNSKPYKNEKNSREVKDFKPIIKLIETQNELTIQLNFDDSLNKVKTELVNTNRLGQTFVSEAIYVKPNESFYRFDTDFLGNKRNINQPLPGPFENLKKGMTEIEFVQDLPKLNQ